MCRAYRAAASRVRASPTPIEKPLSDRSARPAGRETDCRPSGSSDALAQQDGRDDRCEHDVGSGDEARHGCRRRREALGLEDLCQAVERAEPDSDEHLPAAQGAHGSPEDDEHDDGRKAEAHREEVDRRDRLDEVADEEEGRAPHGGERDEQQRGQARARRGGHGPVRRSSGVIVLPLGTGRAGGEAPVRGPSSRRARRRGTASGP